MTREHRWHSKFAALWGVVVVLILLVGVLTVDSTRRSLFLEHPATQLVLAILIGMLGVDIIVVSDFWIDRYTSSLAAWRIHLPRRMTFAMVIISGLTAALSGLALAAKILGVLP